MSERDKKRTKSIWEPGGDPAYERMMKNIESGKLGGTMRQSRPDSGQGRPFQAPPRDESMPPSKAPRGMANAVEGNLGMYRQQEARKVFPGLPGKDTSNPLHFRKPMTGIDPEFGPGDKVS